MTITLVIIIKCLISILVGIFAGNGAVYVFNHLPAKWFCDYGETPSEDLTDPYVQRVKSYPWKFVLTMVFVAIGIKLVMDNWTFAIGAICVLWLLVEMSIADIKYRIVPDQLIILLCVSAIGFIQFQNSWKDCLIGALIGFGVMFVLALVGKIVYGRDALGGGDIKLFSGLGLVLGPMGILVVFAMTALISGGHVVCLLAMKKIKRSDAVPMVPYITVAVGIYVVFLWGYFDVLLL